MDFSDKELLNFAIENGMIDTNTIRKQIEMNERYRYLEMHPYKIWKGNNQKWYTYLPDDGKERRLVKRNTEDDIKNAIIEYWKSNEEKIYFCDVFNEWMHKRREYEELEMTSYARYYTDFNRFFKDDEHFCKIIFLHIKESDIEDFIKKQIHEKNLTEKSYSMLRLLIMGTFRYAKSRGYTNISISTFFKDLYLPKNIFRKKKLETAEDEVFNDDEALLLANYFRDNPTIINMGLLLQFQTGLRIGELVSLKREDICGKYIMVRKTEDNYKDPDTGESVNRVKDTTKTPTGERAVIIPDGAKDTIRMILALSQNEEYLFSRNGKRITTRVFRYHIRNACQRVGIKPRPPHKARKTYASTLLSNNVDETLVKEMMGHKDISTTHKCYHYNTQTKIAREKEIDRAMTI